MTQQEGVHPRILQTIRWLQRDRGFEEEKRQHRAADRPLNLSHAQNVTRPSVQYLVDFMSGEEISYPVTHLTISEFDLVKPSDGGLDVLRGFLVNPTCTLTAVTLRRCSFGSDQEAASQLLAAVKTNRSVTDLTIDDIGNVQGDAGLGRLFSDLLHSNSTLQSFSCEGTLLTAFIINHIQPGLRANQNLKALNLSQCTLENEDIGLIADALVGNTTMEFLNISYNFISSDGLDEITRLLEHTQLRKIDFGENLGVFDDDAASKRFANVLSQNRFMNTLKMFGNVPFRSPGAAPRMIFQALEANTTVQEVYLGPLRHILDYVVESIPRIKCVKHLDLTSSALLLLQNAAFLPSLHENTSLEVLPISGGYTRHHRATIVIVNSILERNKCMRRSKELLALQPRTGLPIRCKSGLWYMAMAQMGRTSSGASAMFQFLSMRPALLENQLKRPPPQQPVTVGVDSATSIVNNNNNNNNGDAQKRARLS